MLRLILLNALLLFLPMPQNFVIIGRVRDQAGQAVTNVRATLLDDSYGQIRTSFLDAGGGFRFPGLSSGVYHVRIETGSTIYEEQTQRVELQTLRIRGGGNEPILIDFTLKPKQNQPSPVRQIIFAQEVPTAAREEFERGAAHLRGNKVEMGYAALKKAIEIFPNYFDALELLGSEYVKRGELEPALPVLMRAVTVNRRASKSLYAIGVAYLKLNRLTDAVEWLKKSAEADPVNPNVHMMLGLAYGNNNEYASAETAFLKALQTGGKLMAEAHFYLAGIYNKQGRYSDAVSRLERYLKEAQDIKDRNTVKNMIENMKEKEKARTKN